MRYSLLILTALPLVAVAASAEDTVLKTPLNNPASSIPAKPWISIEDTKERVAIETVERVRPDAINDQNCRDKISNARQLLGQPPLLNREPASPTNPHLIYAVDRRQDGCSVMVMKGDPDDIRPLPSRMEGSPLLPADSKAE